MDMVGAYKQFGAYKRWLTGKISCGFLACFFKYRVCIVFGSARHLVQRAQGHLLVSGLLEASLHNF